MYSTGGVSLIFGLFRWLLARFDVAASFCGCTTWLFLLWILLFTVSHSEMHAPLVITLCALRALTCSSTVLLLSYCTMVFLNYDEITEMASILLCFKAPVLLTDAIV